MTNCMCSNPDCRLNGCLNVRMTQRMWTMPVANRWDGDLRAPLRPTPTGWECPRCQSIHAPHIDHCNCVTTDKGARA